MSMRKIKPIIVGVALAAVLLLCNHQTIDSESGLDVEDATSLSVLRIGFMQQIDSMNPFVGLNDASRFFYGLVYDALTSVGNNLEAVPNLAVSNWIVPTGYDSDPKLIGMPYGSVLQYNLTDSAYFTDGVRFTADDVIYNV